MFVYFLNKKLKKGLPNVYNAQTFMDFFSAPHISFILPWVVNNQEEEEEPKKKITENQGKNFGLTIFRNYFTFEMKIFKQIQNDVNLNWFILKETIVESTLFNKKNSHKKSTNLESIHWVTSWLTYYQTNSFENYFADLKV